MKQELIEFILSLTDAEIDILLNRAEEWSSSLGVSYPPSRLEQTGQNL